MLEKHFPYRTPPYAMCSGVKDKLMCINGNWSTNASMPYANNIRKWHRANTLIKNLSKMMKDFKPVAFALKKIKPHQEIYNYYRKAH